MSDHVESNLSAVERQLMLQLDLEDELAATSSLPSDDNSRKLILNYLNVVRKCPIKINDDFKNLEWINVSKPLSLSQDLKGLITLCDFFTYCCINCLHILPFLNKIEQKYFSKEIQVLGVHSPKFKNEKSLENVVSAVVRHEICHPVCNDPELKLWNQLSIRCWPTVAIISPNGELLFVFMGENAIQNKIEFYIDICLEYFSNEKQLNLKKKLSLPISLLKEHQQKSQFNYPTKVALSSDGIKIAIANTLSHHIIVTTLFGLVEFIVGSIKAGFKDGPFEQALFNYPQGISWTDQNIFYVCDTENHAIRKVDLISKKVETVAQSLNSPWDLAYNPIDNRLYIAMAGAHQIWTLILSERGDTIHGNFQPYKSCLCFAGDGNEQKRNHRSLLKSSFAQPSGLTLKSNIIYVADSESSSIRTIDLQSNSVSTLIGGSADPLNLFAFGDIDGIGSKCRLQHCMGICSANDDIFIADTFNHKIKKIELSTKKCEKLDIIWDKIEDDKKYLNEPNGLCFIKQKNILIIADTNNHRIVSVNLDNGQASIFNLFNPGTTIGNLKMDEQLNDNIHKNDNDITFTERLLEFYMNQEVKILLCFHFNNELKANNCAKQKIKCTHLYDDKNIIQIEPNNMITEDLNDVKFVIRCLKSPKIDTMQIELSFECQLNLCHSKKNYCTFRKLLVKQPLLINNKNSNDGEKVVEKFINIKL